MLGVFDLLNEAWEVYKDRFGTLIGIAAVPVVGTVVLGLLSAIIAFVGGVFLKGLSLKTPAGLFLVGVASLVAAVLILFVYVWPSVALIYAVKERKREMGFKRSFKETWPMLFPYLWVGFLSGLAVFVGLVLLIVPGIIFMVWFSLAAYVLVAEGKKGTKALSRSKELVRGHWWPVLGRLAILWLLGLVVGGVLGSVPVLGPIVLTPVVTNILLTSFSAVFLYLLYEDLEQERNVSQ